VPDLVRGIMPEGVLKGLQYFSHRGSAIDKTMKLSSRNTSIRPDNGLHRIVDDPEDDWSTYKLLDFMIQNHLPEGWTGFLFVRPASPKLMDQRLAAGLKFTGNDGPTGKYGKNQPTLIFRRLATVAALTTQIASPVVPLDAQAFRTQPRLALHS
jgi:hypothetical protein